MALNPPPPGCCQDTTFCPHPEMLRYEFGTFGRGSCCLPYRAIQERLTALRSREMDNFLRQVSVWLVGQSIFDWAIQIILYNSPHTNHPTQISYMFYTLATSYFFYKLSHTNVWFSSGGADQMVMVWQANLVGVADPHQTPSRWLTVIHTDSHTLLI